MLMLSPFNCLVAGLAAGVVVGRNVVRAPCRHAQGPPRHRADHPVNAEAVSRLEVPDLPVGAATEITVGAQVGTPVPAEPDLVVEHLLDVGHTVAGVARSEEHTSE